jgi:CheY-like chemotaxis protein
VSEPPRALVAVPDLFLRPKVEEGVRAAGLTPEATRPSNLAARAAEASPACAVLDLEAPGALDVVRAIRADPATAELPLLGFCGHLRVELIREGRAAGCTRVVARSEMARRLDRIVTELTAG